MFDILGINNTELMLSPLLEDEYVIFDGNVFVVSSSAILNSFKMLLEGLYWCYLIKKKSINSHANEDALCGQAFV